jgi:excisionase family DNA binding protein
LSIASERRSLVDLLPTYALLKIPELAAFLGCSEDVAREMVDAGTIPSVRIGARRHVDPVDAVVYVLAEREGITAAQFWAVNGSEQTVELVRKHVARIRRLVA